MTAKSGDAIAEYVRAMARGPSRGRGLTQDEARDALTQIMAGNAAAEAVGALFMLMRYRGEDAGEIAGFVEAMRARIPDWRTLHPAIDWPSYAAGRTRGAPLFLLAAKLVACTGRSVAIHGWNSHLTHPASTIKGARALGIPFAATPAQARDALAAEHITYIPLGDLDAEALRLLQLRTVLGLRSPLNTALRALNPTGAQVSVQGVFHPTYRALQSDSAQLLSQHAMGVVKGGGGEFERHPGKAIELYGYNAAGPFDLKMPALDGAPAKRMKSDGEAPSIDAMMRLWDGSARDEFAKAIVIATTGAALFVAGAETDIDRADQMAEALWEDRQT